MDASVDMGGGVVRFLRGFGSALSLAGTGASTLKFKLRGNDILALTPEQAIRQDWSTFGKDFRCSVRKITEHEQSDASAESGLLVSR